MVKLKIFPRELCIRRADIPVSTELQIIKLSYEEAMEFDVSPFYEFDDLLRHYGYENRLKAEELYEGYVLAYYAGIKHADVIYMNGFLRTIDPRYAHIVYDANLAQNIKEGRAWECRYPTEDGTTNGRFDYVWTFKGCRFSSSILWDQKQNNLFQGVDAELMDTTLKAKVVAALLTPDKFVTLSEMEDKVLLRYLGRKYYEGFFVECVPDPPAEINL